MAYDLTLSSQLKLSLENPLSIDVRRSTSSSINGGGDALSNDTIEPAR